MLAAGVQTAVQDWPGRQGYWDVGVPPSGPMDAYAHRMANQLVGNAFDAATLECTLQGPTLKFHTAAVIAVTGAPVRVTLDGMPLAPWTSHRVPAGSTVKSIARYDNSRNNRRNPAPQKEVYWSEQSWDDMYLTNVSYINADDTSEN